VADKSTSITGAIVAYVDAVPGWVAFVADTDKLLQKWNCRLKSTEEETSDEHSISH